MNCPKCSGNRNVLRDEAKRNEKRLRAGKRPVLSVVSQAKADLAECAARGHERACVTA